MNSTAGLELIIRLRDEATRQLNGLSGTISGIGAVAVAATAAAGAALVGFGAVAVGEFAQFDSGMREVFTLLPGISQQAMDAMSGDVHSFAQEFGVLPNDVIPALYQALSAGVPSDNVFKFLETAQMAAVAGVTDLTTAVDGISSVVNAYGSDVISAAEASDYMFTAVRLGKTTFEELSSSMSNVTPIAAAIGVGFDEVAAALAVMTAQGIPTAQATTQIRAALVELSKDGTKVASVFEDIAGQSFGDFVQSGGSVQDALQLLEQHAADTGVGINDLFGSVEAGSAVLALTGSNTEAFTAALGEMDNAAGATSAAYDVMKESLTQSFNKIKAAVSSATIQFGERLAPTVARVADALSQALPVAVDKVLAVMDVLVPKIGSVIGPLTDLFAAVFTGGDWISYLSQMLTNLAMSLGLGSGPAMALGASVRGIVEGVQQAAAPILAFITQFVGLREIMLGVGVAIASVVVPMIGGLVLAFAPVIATFVAVVAAVALLRAAWESNFLGIRDVVATAFGAIIGFIQAGIDTARALWEQHGTEVVATVQSAFATVQAVFATVLGVVVGIVSGVLAGIIGFWQTHGAEVQATVSTFLTAVMTVVQTIFTTIQTVVGTALTLVQTLWTNHGTQVQTFVTTFLTMVWTTFSTVLATVQTVVMAVLTALATFWANHGQSIITIVQFAFNTIYTVVSTILNALWTFISTILTTIQTFWAQHGDAILLKAQEVWAAIQLAIETVLGIIGTVIDAFALATEGRWEEFGATLRQAWDELWEAIKSAMLAAKDALLGIIGTLIESIFSAFTSADWGSIGSGIVTGIAGAISSGAGAIADAARSAASAALAAAKALLGIQSPSKVFAAEVGKPSMEGMALGIRDEIGTVQRQVERGMAEIANVKPVKLPPIRLSDVISGVPSVPQLAFEARRSVFATPNVLAGAQGVRPSSGADTQRRRPFNDTNDGAITINITLHIDATSAYDERKLERILKKSIGDAVDDAMERTGRRVDRQIRTRSGE